MSGHNRETSAGSMNWIMRSDGSLLRHFREGEQDAATALYVRYAARLQALAASQTSPVLAGRFDPEDVVQSVFLTFFRRVSLGYYDVPQGEELWQLLLVLALNKVRALAIFHRAKKRDVGLTRGWDQLPLAEHGTRAEDEIALQVLRMSVEEALGELTSAEQRMVELRIDGHEVAAIAQQTGRAKRTVERVLQRFRARLNESIHDQAEDDHCHRQE